MCIKGDIKPSNVQMKRIPKGQAQITCMKPKNMYLFHNSICTIKIGRTKLHSGLEWEVIHIEKFESSTGMSYSVSSNKASRYGYAVCYCVDGRSSDWVLAERLNLDQPHSKTKLIKYRNII